MAEIGRKEQSLWVHEAAGFEGNLREAFRDAFVVRTSVPRLCMPSSYTLRYVHTRDTLYVVSFRIACIFMRRAREAMQQRHGRHLPKRKRLFLGCMRSLPSPAPQIFNETFFGKTSFLLLLSPSKISHRTRVVSYSRAKRGRSKNAP